MSSHHSHDIKDVKGSGSSAQSIDDLKTDQPLVTTESSNHSKNSNDSDQSRSISVLSRPPLSGKSSYGGHRIGFMHVPIDRYSTQCMCFSAWLTSPEWPHPDADIQLPLLVREHVLHHRLSSIGLLAEVVKILLDYEGTSLCAIVPHKCLHNFELAPQRRMINHLIAGAQRRFGDCFKCRNVVALLSRMNGSVSVLNIGQCCCYEK